MKRHPVILLAIALCTTVICGKAGAFSFTKSDAKDTKQAAMTAKPGQVKAQAAKPAAETPKAGAAKVQAAGPNAKDSASNAATPSAEPKKMTKQEMVTDLENMLRYHPGIAPTIQGLQVSGEGEKAQFTIGGKPLSELDEATISKLLSSARGQVSAENLQRLDRQQRQLRQMQQIDQMNRTQRMIQQQRAITAANNASRSRTNSLPRTTR